MSPSCDDCGDAVRLERMNVLVRTAGDYQILGACCSFKHAAHKQYQPSNPRAAVDRIRGTVATDGGEER